METNQEKQALSEHKSNSQTIDSKMDKIDVWFNSNVHLKEVNHSKETFTVKCYLNFIWKPGTQDLTKMQIVENKMENITWHGNDQESKRLDILRFDEDNTGFS